MSCFWKHLIVFTVLLQFNSLKLCMNELPTSSVGMCPNWLYTEKKKKPQTTMSSFIHYPSVVTLRLSATAVFDCAWAATIQAITSSFCQLDDSTVVDGSFWTFPFKKLLNAFRMIFCGQMEHTLCVLLYYKRFLVVFGQKVRFIKVKHSQLKFS